MDLVEVALSWNLAKEYQKIQEITPGTLKAFTRAYLRRWDIQNVLTILRGRVQGGEDRADKEDPCSGRSLDKVMLDRLLLRTARTGSSRPSKDHRMYPVLAREYPVAKESGSFSRMENELYKEFYAEIIGECKGGNPGPGIVPLPSSSWI